MKSKRGCLLFVLMLVVLGVLTALALLGVWFLRQRQERARWEYLPPVIQITEPQSGVSEPVGSYLSAVSTITFSPQNPVQTVEWYLNGALVESNPLQAGAGVSQAYDSYNLLIPTEGTHMLLARAINTRGVIGQSQPLTFQGVAKGEAFYAVTVNEGETLESLAAGYGSDAATLQTLNPGLGNPPAPGTTIKVPIPPENEPPSLPPTPLPASGGVTLVATSPILKVADIPSNIFSLLIAAPPQAPTNLQGEVKGCKVKLLWEDNAANESGFVVWMAAPGAPLTRLVTLQPASGGVTWFEFQAPGPGYFLFWVEAVNAIGQQGSNIIYLNVDAGCPAGAATHLQIELLDMSVSGNYDRAYCYVSLEEAPEVRLPAQDGDFIQVQGGQGNVAAWPHTFGVSIPSDGALEISGECWGWSGASLDKLGVFSSPFAKEMWDGLKLVIPAGNAQIGVAVKPLSPMDTRETYVERAPGLPSPGSPGTFLYDEYPVDPNLTPPTNLSRSDVVDPTPPHLRHVVLYWDYEAGPSDSLVNGFTIFLNGIPFKTINQGPSGGSGRDEREAILLLPLEARCGKHLRWQVAANAGPAQSRLSEPLEYDLPPCEVYAMVEFIDIYLLCTADSAPDCMYVQYPASLRETLDVYYDLSVNSTTARHWGGTLFVPMTAGFSNFSDLGAYYWEPFPDTIVVPILTNIVDLVIRTKFWDHDDSSGDDMFGSHYIHLYYPDLQAARNDLGCGKIFKTEGWSYTGTAISNWLRVKVTIFPNECSKSPPFGTFKWMKPGGLPKADLRVEVWPTLSPKVEVRIHNDGPDWVDMDVQLMCLGKAEWTDATGVVFTKMLAPGAKTIHLTLKNGEVNTFYTGIKDDPSYSNLGMTCRIPALEIDPNPANNDSGLLQLP